MIILSEVSLTEKDKYYMISLICVSLRMLLVNLLIKQKETHRQENNITVTKGERMGRDKVGVWD